MTCVGFLSLLLLESRVFSAAQRSPASFLALVTVCFFACDVCTMAIAFDVLRCGAKGELPLWLPRARCTKIIVWFVEAAL